jgi:hypothetical protein
MTASMSNDSLSRAAPASTVGTSVATSSASAAAPAPVPAATAPNAVRARAVRLIREAVAAGNSHGNANTTSGAALSSGEVAFAVEEAAMTAFGAGHPRYYEFVSKLAFSFKVRPYQQFVVLCCADVRLARSWNIEWYRRCPAAGPDQERRHRELHGTGVPLILLFVFFVAALMAISAYLLSVNRRLNISGHGRFHSLPSRTRCIETHFNDLTPHRRFTHGNHNGIVRNERYCEGHPRIA